MGKILELAKSVASEIQLASRHGRWILAVSQAADQILSFAAGELNALAGRGLVPNGTELDVGQNPDSSIIVNGDNVQLNPSYSISVTGGQTYQTSPSWYLDAATGNDANNGTTPLTPLKTPAELQKRFQGRIVPQNTTITATGTFSQPFMMSEVIVLQGFTISLLGQAPTVQYSGSLTAAFVPYAPATNVDAKIVDAGRVFAADAQLRVRMTSGVASGALTRIMKDLGANTARVGQFVNRTTGAAATPANGDTYVIETLNTQFGGIVVDIHGGGAFIGKDLIIKTSVTQQGIQLSAGQGALEFTPRQCVLDGCDFDVTTAFDNTSCFQSDAALVACAVRDGAQLRFVLSTVDLFGIVNFGFVSAQAGARVSNIVLCVAQDNGNGFGWGCFFSVWLNAAPLGVFDQNSGNPLEVEGGYMTTSGIANTRIFGSVSRARAILVRSGSQIFYTTGEPPVMAGSTTADMSIGGADTNYAALPVCSAANNAAVAVRA